LVILQKQRLFYARQLDHGPWRAAQWLQYLSFEIYCLTQVEDTLVLKMKIIIIIILLNIQRRQDLKWKRP
jgi:hypothetical protein